MSFETSLKFNFLPNITYPFLRLIGSYMQIVDSNGEKPLTSKLVYDQIKERGLMDGVYAYWILCRYVANKNNLINFLDIGTTAVALIGIVDTLNVVRTDDPKNQPFGKSLLKADGQRRKRKTAQDRLDEDLNNYLTKSSNWFSNREELDEAADNVRISAQASLMQAIIGEDTPNKNKQQSGW